MREGRISMDQPCVKNEGRWGSARIIGAEPHRPTFFETSYIPADSMRDHYRILYSDLTICS